MAGVRGLPMLEIDVAAPETLGPDAVETITVKGIPARVYALHRIAGEKLRAYLTSLPAYRRKMQGGDREFRVKDLHDIARILRARPVSDAKFWTEASHEFQLACESRLVDCRGTAAEVGEIAAAPIRLFPASRRFVGMMHHHHGAVKFPEQRIQMVPQEAADILLRIGFPAEIRQSQVNPKQIRLVIGEQGTHGFSEELPARPHVLTRHDDICHRHFLFGIRQVQTFDDAVAHFGQVALVIFRLNEQWFQRAGRENFKRLAPQRPKNHVLHGQRAFADAGWPDQQQPTAPAKKPVSQ